MAGRDDMEPWYWQDESFKLDTESPLAIPTSLWEELTHSGGGSPNLFGTAPPLVDTRIHLCKPPYHTIARDHQGSDINGSSSSEYGKQHGERYKRRRMLHFAGARTESCIPALVSHNDEFMLPVPCGLSSPTPLWFSRVDDVSYSVPTHSEQPADKWMCRFFDDKACSAYEQICAPILPFSHLDTSLLGGDHVQQTSCKEQSLSLQRLRTTEKKNHVLQSQHRLQPQQLQEAEVLQGPQTPFFRPPIPGRKKSMDPTRFRGQSSNCVAFPFALVKPSAAQGDVTLNDINKHLLSPPPKPEQKPFPTNIEKLPAQSGSWLSGKSVVACTKIHTEGNGTITIMRTRG